MRSKFMNLIAMILVLSIVLFIAACSGQETNATSDNSQKQHANTNNDTSSDGVAKNGEKIEIEYWYGLGGNLGELMQETIEAFNNSQDKIVVEGIQYGDYGETSQAIQAAIAANEVPASALMSWHSCKTFGERGLLEPLNDYIDKDEDFNLDDFFPVFLEYGQLGDKLYCLPTYGTTQILYYRKDAFEEAGIDPNEALKTWEGLADAARKLTKREGDEVVFYGWEPMWGIDNFTDAVRSKGVELISEDGTKVMFTSPEWIETMENFRKWIHEEKIMRIHYGGQGWEYWYATIDDVMEGRAAGYTGSSGDMGDLDFDIIGAHIQPGWEGHDPAPYADAVMSCILAMADPVEKEAAFEWLTFLTSTDTNANWCIKSGYVPVRKSVQEQPNYKALIEENPARLVPIQQLEVAAKQYYDPTDGKITQALSDAIDKILIENIPAEEALKEANEIAQQALDEYLASQSE